MSTGRERSVSAPVRVAEAVIREDILQRFPGLFGTKTINGREIKAEQAIAAFARELDPEIAAALTARRALLRSPAPVRVKYAWPKWDDTFEDPVTGQFWTFRQIVQGLINNFLGRESERRWRLNDEVPIPTDAHPLTNPGLELTGPWHPLDMAFNALNSPAPMNMPDFEDASPPHFRPDVNFGDVDSHSALRFRGGQYMFSQEKGSRQMGEIPLACSHRTTRYRYLPGPNES